MQALGRQGVDEPHMNVSEDTYMDSKATIELNNSIQLRKELGKVTKYQKLYDLLKKKTDQREDVGITIVGENYLNNLRFADRMALLSESEENLRRMIKEFHGKWSESRSEYDFKENRYNV